MDATETLLFIFKRMEEGEDLKVILENEFNIEGVTSVDRCKAVYAEVNSKVELAKAHLEDVKLAIKKYELIADEMIANTKQFILSNPGISFRDSLGKALKVIPTPTPRVVLTQSVPAEFSKVTLTPNKEFIKDRLMKGEELEFAYLEYGNQLRGMR